MKNKLVLFSFVCLILTGQHVFGQKGGIDSLLNVLKTAKEDTEKVKTQLNLSRKYRVKGDLDASKKTAEDALVLARKLDYKKGEANAYNFIGIVYWGQANYSDALKNYSLSLDISKAGGDKKAAGNVYNNIALIYFNMGNYPEALKNHFASLKLREETSDKAGIAASYNNLANVYWNQGDTANALKNHFAAFKIRKEMNDSIGMAGSSINIGNMYDLMNQDSLALKYLYGGLELLAGKDHPQDVASAWDNIGTIYKEHGQFEEAQKSHLTSLAIRNSINDQDGIAASSLNLAALYIAWGKIAQVKPYLEKAYEISSVNGDKVNLKEYYLAYHELDSMTGNFSQALLHFKMFVLYRDSIINEKNTAESVQARMQYDYNKQNQADSILTVEKEAKEKLIQDQKLAEQQTYTYGGIIGFVLMLIVAGVSFRAYKQKRRANDLISEQKAMVEEKQKEILDSIHYAERIQRALLASKELLNQNLKEYFVLFRPKDIVSGDFYWATNFLGKRFYLAVCDSTGHGVPGAFMSLLNISFMNEAISEKGLSRPNEIFNHTRTRLITNLSQQGAQDGMDGILFNLEGTNLQYAAANNAPFIIRNGEIIMLNADKIPVGKSPRDNVSFSHHEVTLEKGDLLIAYTDGYADQFGGPKGKKFKYKPLNELILANADRPLNELREILNGTLDEWKQNLEQVDDILIVGIRV
jgi:serine phosphatase RsbU (regulator of sigma subunit)